MSQRLQNRIAVITGAGSGIGRAIAERFHREGARLVLGDISGAEGEVAEALGEQALARHADVSRSEDVKALIDAAIERYGGLDILCNVAGYDGELGPLADSSEANFEKITGVNLRGVFLGMKYAIPQMLARGGGSIVNIASVAGLVAMPGMSAYGASKAGVVQLSRNAALEYARQGLRINAICPGLVDTPMIAKLSQTHPQARDYGIAATPMARFGRAEEIAAAALFLASDEASFITGIAMPVDGGYVVA